jgi:uncharacterized protein
VKQRAQIHMLPGARRLHLHDGPIDIVLEAFGDPRQIDIAYRAAAARFVHILDELCSELAFLRQPAGANDNLPAGPIARCMAMAVRPYAPQLFITPMAAVAGAVAEDVLTAMTSAANFSRAYVNDGGDIALYLTPGETFAIGMAESPDQTASIGLLGTTCIRYADPVRGIATSGWRGRSFSLGIADAVTVLAQTASMADAAATVIANAVDLPGSFKVKRARACDLAPDSDLGDRLITKSVGVLEPGEIHDALHAGMRTARSLAAAGLIHAVALNLQGETQIVQDDAGSLLFDPIDHGRLIHA